MIYRRIIPLFILALLLFSFAERKYKNDLAKENLKGKVKMVTERSYIIKRPSPKDSLALLEFKYVRLYDAAGNMTDETTYSRPDSIRGFINKYQYSDKGIRTAKETYRDTNLVKRYTYTTDADGKVIGEEEYGRKGLTARGKYTYDAHSNKTDYTTIGVKDSLMVKMEYAYDSKGRIQQQTSYVAGKMIWSQKSKYDDKNDLSENQYLGREGKVTATEKYRYTYDKTNNWTQKTTTIRDSVTHVVTRVLEYWP